MIRSISYHLRLVQLKISYKIPSSSCAKLLTPAIEQGVQERICPCDHRKNELIQDDREFLWESHLILKRTSRKLARQSPIYCLSVSTRDQNMSVHFVQLNYKQAGELTSFYQFRETWSDLVRRKNTTWGMHAQNPQRTFDEESWRQRWCSLRVARGSMSSVLIDTFFSGWCAATPIYLLQKRKQYVGI